MANEGDREELQFDLKGFLDSNNNAAEKLDSLVCTVERIEHEYQSREKQRLNDLQFILNNAYVSKGVLRHTKDYKMQLINATKEVTNQINTMNKQIKDLSDDVIVNENRFNEYRNNVVAQAEECQWEDNKLFSLLESDIFSDDDNEPDLSKEYDKSIKDLTEFTTIGSLGLQLSIRKKAIEQRNVLLDLFATHFKKMRYGHAMQYHRDKEAYILYRKHRDKEKQIYQMDELVTPKASSKIRRNSDHDSNSGLLIDLNDED